VKFIKKKGDIQINYLFCILLYLFPLFVIAIDATTDTIKIRGTRLETDPLHNYYEGLIKLAYEKSGITVKITYTPPMNQARAIHELKKGSLIDIVWAGANATTLNNLSVVDIPLTKGLTGYRSFITHKDNIKKLKTIKTLQDLKNIIICHGTHWADTKILLKSGLNILQNSSYEGLFQQTHIKRCDAYPRGINEVLPEVNARKNKMPNLTVYNDLILFYPFPIYFFTSPDNLRVKNIIKSGLEAAIDDGSFDEYIKTHPTTMDLFPLTKWNKATLIKLNNPYLPSNVDTDNKRYWLTPNIITQ
jgi:hypothetical protein